jgi:hypothetical protein
MGKPRLCRGLGLDLIPKRVELREVLSYRFVADSRPGAMHLGLEPPPYSEQGAYVPESLIRQIVVVAFALSYEIRQIRCIIGVVLVPTAIEELTILFDCRVRNVDDEGLIFDQVLRQRLVVPNST